jgi:hypothetical protein
LKILLRFPDVNPRAAAVTEFAFIMGETMFKTCLATGILIFAGIFCTQSTAFAVSQTRYVLDVAEADSFPVVQSDEAALLYVDSKDWAGVIRAVGDLQSDINRVAEVKPEIVNASEKLSGQAVIIGTIGKSRLIDDLAARGKIDVESIKGEWESFFLQVVDNPLPQVERALVIAGSDKRGTIYGIYDLSGQMGISPVYWWADVPVKHRDAIHVRRGKFRQGPPSVKYRGIFINDEAPDLSNWVRETFGTVPVSEDPPVPEGVANYNSEFYARIFEAILRMKGNYLWPAMWNNAFNEDDPKNPALADEYGIVMGTSHQEPMLRAQKEWDRRYSRTL